jgi:hypothetical protein
MPTSSLADAPPGAGESARLDADPPAAEIFLSLPPAKNPIQRPSGEKKGADPPSVPDSRAGSRRSTGRT